MDIRRLYQDYSIPYATESDRHYQTGWINTPCPYCTGNPGNHLGYHLQEEYYNCYRCGWHSTVNVISKLTHLPTDKAKVLIRQYGGRSRSTSTNVTIRRKAHRLPSGTGPLLDGHKQYLAGRGFDPDRLERDWGLLSTGPLAKLDHIDYKHRIVAPITWDGTQVSFQARDVTGRATRKYMACPQERELIQHKHILYGDQERWGPTGVCVEGVTDVWRFGPASFCTFGIKYTPRQLRWIALVFKRVFVVFDEDKLAQWQGRTLTNELEFRGVEAHQVKITGDPGGMKQTEADYLLKTLLK